MCVIREEGVGCVGKCVTPVAAAVTPESGRGRGGLFRPPPPPPPTLYIPPCKGGGLGGELQFKIVGQEVGGERVGKGERRHGLVPVKRTKSDFHQSTNIIRQN